MSVIDRLVLTSDTNGVSPTGMNKADSVTMLRKYESHLGRLAQGAAASSLSMAYKPVSALATVTTTNGSETQSDTLTIGNTAVVIGSSAGQAHIAAGTKGTSTSGATPATTTAGVALSFFVNVNGDGAQRINVSGTTGAAIAASIQTKIRALTPVNSLNATAFSAATCTYSSTYVITSGVAGSNSSVVVTGADAAKLKLGVLYGGTEAVGTATTMNNIATIVNAGAAWSGMCTAYASGNVLTLSATIPGTIGNGLALAVSSTGSVMSITHAWGAATAGTEGTSYTFHMGL